MTIIPVSDSFPSPLQAEIVIVDWSDLISNNNNDAANSLIFSALEQAYGSTGTGLLGVRNVPDFVAAKQRLLPLAHTLANLPSDYLDNTLTDPASLYNAGWSFGREKLGSVPDTSKGSFYYCPQQDVPGTEEDRIQYPYSYPKNLWPTELLPALEPAAKKLGCILSDVAIAVAKKLDQHVLHTHNIPSSLYEHMKDAPKVKGRLLYYFPLAESANKSKEDSWIGWHNDSGYLTALAGDLYMNHATGQVVTNSDPTAGLYVINRHDQVLRVLLPHDCCAIQLGECTQIVTGGAVTATPHCVRAGQNANDGVARVSLAVFVDVPPCTLLAVPEKATREQVLAASLPSNKVPPLDGRWVDDMTFGTFLQKTFEHYYQWNDKSE